MRRRNRIRARTGRHAHVGTQLGRMQAGIPGREVATTAVGDTGALTCHAGRSHPDPGVATVVRVLTWNIRGGHRPDLRAIAGVIGESAPDVAALQEIQRRQARELADWLGLCCTWKRKHHPLLRPAEGQAILSTGPSSPAKLHVLNGAPPWSWRRRIAVSVAVATDAGDVVVVCVHLASAGAEGRRVREVTALLAMIGGAERIVLAGDLNSTPPSPTMDRLARAGFLDPWAVLRRPRIGTCWSTRDRTGAPSQQLDHVLVRRGLPIDIQVIAPAGLSAAAMLSDHLPVVADLAWSSGD